MKVNKKLPDQVLEGRVYAFIAQKCEGELANADSTCFEQTMYKTWCQHQTYEPIPYDSRLLKICNYQPRPLNDNIDTVLEKINRQMKEK